MNMIEVNGGKKAEREIARDVVAFCIKKLMPRIHTLDIEVSFKKIDVYGYCMEGENNRTFELQIRKGLGLFDLISTICHEMIHVKQYATKELRYVNGSTMWKKSLVSDNVDYMNQPWEKEAYRLEKRLALECFENLETIL